MQWYFRLSDAVQDSGYFHLRAPSKTDEAKNVLSSRLAKERNHSSGMDS
jgi:hypothetical protein